MGANPPRCFRKTGDFFHAHAQDSSSGSPSSLSPLLVFTITPMKYLHSTMMAIKRVMINTYGSCSRSESISQLWGGGEGNGISQLMNFLARAYTVPCGRPRFQSHEVRTPYYVTLTMIYLHVVLFEILVAAVTFSCGHNISCYQCIRYGNEQCSNDSLLPCPSTSDRCVTHVSKDGRNGYMIKRECGLGPCGFEDDMVNRGLGMGGCDRSKDEYFCVSCCRTSGCNKNKGPTSTIPHPSSALVPIISCFFFNLYFLCVLLIC